MTVTTYEGKEVEVRNSDPLPFLDGPHHQCVSVVFTWSPKSPGWLVGPLVHIAVMVMSAMTFPVMVMITFMVSVTTVMVSHCHIPNGSNVRIS